MANQQQMLDFEPKPERLLGVDEIFEQADETLLRKLEEDRRIERKPASFAGDCLGEYVSMWANTSPDGGMVASGVLNDGRFEGCSKCSTDQVNKLEKVGHVFCPDAKVRTKQVPIRNLAGNRDFIILTRVHYHPDIVVKTSSGKAFVRKGDSKCELRPDEIRELQADKGEISFEQRLSGLSYPDEFDESAIAHFVGTVRKARSLSAALSIGEILAVRHLGKMENGDFTPNHACALLFAKDPLRLIPGCKIRFQRFEGEQEGTGDQYNAVRDEILEVKCFNGSETVRALG